METSSSVIKPHHSHNQSLPLAMAVTALGWTRGSSAAGSNSNSCFGKHKQWQVLFVLTPCFLGLILILAVVRILENACPSTLLPRHLVLAILGNMPLVTGTWQIPFCLPLKSLCPSLPFKAATVKKYNGSKFLCLPTASTCAHSGLPWASTYLPRSIRAVQKDCTDTLAANNFQLYE